MKLDTSVRTDSIEGFYIIKFLVDYYSIEF